MAYSYSASTWAGSPITIHCPFGVTVNLPLESSLELDMLPNKLAEGPKASQGFWQLKVQITKITRKRNLIEGSSNISSKNKEADLGQLLFFFIIWRFLCLLSADKKYNYFSHGRLELWMKIAQTRRKEETDHMSRIQVTLLRVTEIVTYLPFLLDGCNWWTPGLL